MTWRVEKFDPVGRRVSDARTGSLFMARMVAFVMKGSHAIFTRVR